MAKQQHEEEVKFILEIKNGERQFEEALKQYHNFIWQHIIKYRIVGREDDDLYSILSMELYNAIQTYDVNKQVKFMSYLGRLFVSRLSNEIAHSKRVKNGDELYARATRLDDITKESIGSERETSYSEIILMGNYTEEDLSYNYLWTIIHEVLDELSDKYSETFNMVIVEGKTQTEVAKQLGITQAGVRERLKWIRKRLQAKGINGINYQY